MDNGNYITEDKKGKLENELISLKGPERQEILKSLEYAKSLGDLSENAEYHQAREDQGKLESRISQIEHILKTSTVVEKHKGNLAEVGAMVSIEKVENGEKKKYQIVGSEEADMAQNKISNKSPLGSALYGKKKGDTVSVTTPNGVLNYKILEIE